MLCLILFCLYMFNLNASQPNSNTDMVSIICYRKPVNSSSVAGGGAAMQPNGIQDQYERRVLQIDKKNIRSSPCIIPRTLNFNWLNKFNEYEIGPMLGDQLLRPYIIRIYSDIDKSEHAEIIEKESRVQVQAQVPECNVLNCNISVNYILDADSRVVNSVVPSSSASLNDEQEDVFEVDICCSECAQKAAKKQNRLRKHAEMLTEKLLQRSRQHEQLDQSRNEHERAQQEREERLSRAEENRLIKKIKEEEAKQQREAEEQARADKKAGKKNRLRGQAKNRKARAVEVGHQSRMHVGVVENDMENQDDVCAEQQDGDQLEDISILDSSNQLDDQSLSLSGRQSPQSLGHDRNMPADDLLPSDELELFDVSAPESSDNQSDYNPFKDYSKLLLCADLFNRK